MDVVEKSKEDVRSLNDLMDHLIHLVESNDDRFSFEWSVSGNMEIYDKEKEIGYVLKVEKIEYDEEGNAINI